MPITESVVLPTFDELDVEDINISQPVLVASGAYFGKYCDLESKEYMLCKLEEKDPRKCLQEGKAVTMCGHEFFRAVRNSCKAEVEALAKCMEFTSSDTKFYFCNKERAVSDKCFQEKMGLERPPFGYFSQLRLHQSSRPIPKSYTYEFKKQNLGHDEKFEEEAKKLGKNNLSFSFI